MWVLERALVPWNEGRKMRGKGKKALFSEHQTSRQKFSIFRMCIARLSFFGN
jgi:hypothetical protein